MEKILVVEDDESLSRGIQFALEKENWQVFVAGTLAAARSLFKSGDYDLVLLDVMLPDGNGFDFCREIAWSGQTPVIFLTACDEEVNVILGLDLGGDDYITKPFRVRELISRIKAVLRRHAQSNRQDLLTSGEVVLDRATRQVFRGNCPLLLTPIEFKLLEVFMRNPGQVLSREQILDNLWDMAGEYVDDNTLSVYIRRLREKIEREPSNPDYILTVRGFGYKWNQGRGRGEGSGL